jgi:hypothetical protein
MVRGLRCVDDNQGDDADPDPEALSWRWRADSRCGLSAKLDPENGTLVRSAIEAVARAEGLTQAQAFTRIAEIALAAIAADGKLPTLRGDEHAAVVVHLDAANVPAEPASASASAEERSRERVDVTDRARSRERRRPFGRIADGPGLADRVIRRLLCSGRVRTVVHDGDGMPLDLGRSHRAVSEKLFRALLLRDGGCAHPGCGSGHGLEAHHVRHWLHGGRTDLANLVLLCRRHHHAHHDGDFFIVPLGRGTFRFHRADGLQLPDIVDPTGLCDSPRPVETEYAGVSHDAATTRWDGTRLDHDYAVAALARGLHRVNRLSAAG